MTGAPKGSDYFVFHHHHRVAFVTRKPSSRLYDAGLVRDDVIQLRVFHHYAVFHNDGVAYDRAFAHPYASEQDAVFHRAVDFAAVRDNGIVHVGALFILRRDAVLDLGEYGGMIVEQVFPHLGIEQVHTALEVGRDAVDDRDVVVHFVAHHVKFVQAGAQDVLLEIVCAVRVRVVDEGDEQILLDVIDVEVAQLFARVRGNGIAQILNPLVLVRGDDELARGDVLRGISEHRDVRAALDVELFHFLEIDVEGYVRVADDDIVFGGFQHKSAQHIQRFYLALVHLVCRIEDKGRIDGNAAVFAVEVPVAPLSDVVHKAVVVVARDDADFRDVGVHHIGEHEVYQAVSPGIGQTRRRAVYGQVVEMAVFVGRKQNAECVVFHIPLLTLSFRSRPRRCRRAARSRER